MSTVTALLLLLAAVTVGSASIITGSVREVKIVSMKVFYVIFLAGIAIVLLFLVTTVLIAVRGRVLKQIRFIILIGVYYKTYM